MKNITLFTLLIISCIGAFGQNLVGYDSKEIRKHMKENSREMSINNVTNERFKYLKYSDKADRQTLLFFLDADSVCQSIRLICDSGIKEEKVKEFNSKYIKNGENSWIDKRDGKDYLIEIKMEKWSCVITIEPYK